MNRPILITSFQPWLAHQRSNSSDDLVAALQKNSLMPQTAVWLRHLPVSFELAPEKVEKAVRQLQPHAVICCGMAESRQQLCVEKQAKWYPSAESQSSDGSSEHDSILCTNADINKLTADTLMTSLSEDAGSFVCNHLYYSVLDLANKVNWKMIVVFIHIPVLTSDNQTSLLKDFSQMVKKIAKDDA